MLRDTRVYLCGAMSFCEENGVQWRDRLKPFLKGLGIRIFDPCDKPIDFGIEDRKLHAKLLSEGCYDELAKLLKEIRCVDLRMVDISDFLIVNIDITMYTCGTWEEVFLANREKKPILVRCKQGKKKAPPWLFGTLPHRFIFDTWEQVQDYLIEIDNSNEPVSFDRRWYLFDHARTL